MSEPRGIAVFADFDDTLAMQNVARLLLRQFAPAALDRYSKQYRSGQISFREYQERSFDAVETSVGEMQQVVADETELRPGILELLDAVRDANGTMTIVSAGLRFYIEPVLQRHGLEQLSLVCGTASRDGSDSGPFRYDYPFKETSGEPCRGDWATCKCKALEEAGDRMTVFVGDGSTADACAAEKADHVFARDRLLKICNDRHIPATPFEDFTPVTEFVIKAGKTAKAQAR